MVFEQIAKIKWIKKKEHIFFLAVLYAAIALISSYLIFPRTIGMMGVAFTSMLLMPSLNVILNIEEIQAVKEKKYGLKYLWRDHNDVIKVYILMFLGIFIVYGTISVLSEPLTTTKSFSPQLNAAGIRGSAIDINAQFLSILKNNLKIFVVCFILSLIYGAGSVVFLAWNASVWGVVFGYFAKLTSLGPSLNSVGNFFNQLVPFLPHMVTEGLAYTGAAIVGGILSKAVIREKIGTKNFNNVLTDSLMALGVGFIVVITAAVVEVYFYGAYLAK